MANNEYKILSEDAIKYLCGLIRNLASVSEGIDNINLADDKTFSNIHIKNLIDKCLEDANAEAEKLVGALTHLTCEETAIQPTLDNSEINVIYLYSADGNSPYQQFLKISEDKLVDLGSTSISLEDYIKAADAAKDYATKVELKAVTDKIGTTTLTTTDTTITGAIEEVKGIAVSALGDKNFFSTAPIGTILSFAGQTAPHGYLLCNGTSYKVADYPDLYAVIGNTYGGDTENFNVPNLVDKFIQGSTTSGTEKEAGLPNITGTFYHDTNATSSLSGAFFSYTRGSSRNLQNDAANSSSGYVSFDASKSNAIYGNSDTVQPPALTMIYIIKAFHTNEGVDSGGSETAGKSAYEIAVDNGFVGTETEWLESLKGEQGEAGRSIAGITTDENNNVIVTFSDSSTQNIGQLNIDIQADFLTSEGFGNLRYYNGHFQYYDTSTLTWVDTSITPDNVYIMNMIPQPMVSIVGVYDSELGKYKLKWEEPADTIINGQVACIVDKVIIRRKLGSVPANETDGNLVVEIKRNEFGLYKNDFYVDTALTANTDDVYYYKAFPMSTTGFYNTSTLNETVGIKCKDYNLYGFKLDQNESDPASMITYLSDCDNAIHKSAYMNYSTNTFDYGDWGNAWFIKKLKPCMLKYDGTVDYELNPNDYTKKLDGTASNVNNSSYGGNAMVGIPKVYWKIVNNGDNTANIYFSDKQVDTDFHCWSHIDNNGNEIDYCYMPIYNGSNVSSKLRSLSGKAPMVNKAATTEITYAKANNLTSDTIWYTEVFSDRMLINLLLLLIGKSTDTQTVFGAGNNNSYGSNTGIKNAGTMNTKGLFWGNQDNVSGVKIFGMENWYGNIWRRIGGWINDKGTQKIKMTYGQFDGSTTDGYNETGSGYISIANSTPTGPNSGYISKMIVSNNSLIPIVASGSATTYYCDGLWFNNSQVGYAFVGGASDSASRVGALCSVLHYEASFGYLLFGAALSCKPLATI